MDSAQLGGIGSMQRALRSSDGAPWTMLCLEGQGSAASRRKCVTRQLKAVLGVDRVSEKPSIKSCNVEAEAKD